MVVKSKSWAEQEYERESCDGRIKEPAQSCLLVLPKAEGKQLSCNL